MTPAPGGLATLPHHLQATIANLPRFIALIEVRLTEPVNEPSSSAPGRRAAIPA